MCDCKVGPGKFEGESALTFLAWQQVMIGGADATTGGEDHCVDWFRAPLNFDADASVIAAAKEHGYCDACLAAANDEGADLGGLSVWTCGQGFVYRREYATREAFDRALARAEAADERAGDDDAEGC